MSEQIISAELHRDDDGTVVGITFNGVRYEPVAAPVEAAEPALPIAVTHLGGQFEAVWQDTHGNALFGFRSTT